MDQDQDLRVKHQDKDKDKDLSSKDKDHDFKFVLKDSLRTRTTTLDLGSLLHFPALAFYMIYVHALTRGRHCSGLGGVYAL